jgi:hypothetical protein
MGGVQTKNRATLNNNVSSFRASNIRFNKRRPRIRKMSTREIQIPKLNLYTCARIMLNEPFHTDEQVVRYVMSRQRILETFKYWCILVNILKSLNINGLTYNDWNEIINIMNKNETTQINLNPTFIKFREIVVNTGKEYVVKCFTILLNTLMKPIGEVPDEFTREEYGDMEIPMARINKIENMIWKETANIRKRILEWEWRNEVVINNTQKIVEDENNSKQNEEGDQIENEEDLREPVAAVEALGLKNNEPLPPIH